MREIDHAHQPEDQRETRRHEKIQRAKRDASEQRVEKICLRPHFATSSGGQGAKTSQRKIAMRIATIRVRIGLRLMMSSIAAIPGSPR